MAKTGRKISSISVLVMSAILILVLSLSVMAAKTGVKVEVSLSRDTIGMDEQAFLEVKVIGDSKNLPEPHLPTLPTFEVYQQGKSSNYSWTNGVVSSSVTYRYLLLPKKAGIYPIDQISVVVGNKRFKGNSVELTVSSKGQTTVSQSIEQQAVQSDGNSRDYFLEAVIDKTTPYVNEQVLLTLKFYIAVQYYGSPELNEPTTTGFWAEVIGNKSPYYQRINGRRYKVVERLYALFPTQTGKLEIGRATIKATVAGKRRSKNPFNTFGSLFGSGQDVTVRSNPLTIKVKPLPTEARPDEFGGTIGQFNIFAKADKVQVDVNQPVTVTISIQGTGNVKSVAAPFIPESDDFRVYRASSKEKTATTNNKLGGTKIFEEVFIPKRPGRLEIPAFTFAYFDPVAKRYRVKSTKPVQLTVTIPEGYAADPEIPYGAPGMTIGSDARDIRHIKVNDVALHKAHRLILFEPAYLVVNGLPFLALIGVVLVRRRREKMMGNSAYARSRTAGKIARRRLAQAHSLASVEKAPEFYAEIYRAVTSYVADKLDISPHGLTSDSISDLLQQRSANETLIADVQAILANCDMARYASAAISIEDIDQSLSQAEKVMTDLEGVHFG